MPSLQDQATQYQLTHANVPVGIPTNPVTAPTTGVSDPNGLRYGTFTPTTGGYNTPDFWNQLSQSAPSGQFFGANPDAYTNPVTPPTTGGGVSSSLAHISGPPITQQQMDDWMRLRGWTQGSAPSGGDYKTVDNWYMPTDQWNRSAETGQWGTQQSGGGGGSGPSSTTPPATPVMPPTGLNPTQSNALKFSDPGTSFTPFQAQTFSQTISSPFGSQQMPSFNMQSFKYPPMNPSNGGGKNWWEMQW